MARALLLQLAADVLHDHLHLHAPPPAAAAAGGAAPPSKRLRTGGEALLPLTLRELR